MTRIPAEYHTRFVELVAKMRQSQRDFYADRRETGETWAHLQLLEEAKRLEREVDAALGGAWQQDTLFGPAKPTRVKILRDESEG